MIGAGLILAALVALEPAPAPPGAEPPPSSVWYGGLAVASDAATTALIIGGLASHHDTLVELGFAGFALGGPINHVDHGHLGRAFGSFGLRAATGAAAYGLVVMLTSTHCSGEHGAAPGSCALGLLAPFLMLGAMLGDDALLARESAPDARSGLFVRPGVAIARGGGLLSLAGRF